MKKLKIKHDKFLLAVLILLLILSILGYAYIFYASYARDEFFQTSLKIANQNQNSVFRVSRILLYSSANAIDNSSNKSLQDLSICQYTDIALSIDNTSYISELTTTNTVKELYIDNIQITTNGGAGSQYLNYKNLNDFGVFDVLSVPENGRIDFSTLPVIEPRVREILLRWLSDAMEDAEYSARTDDGRRFVLDMKYAQEKCVVHCEDGNFTMPKISIVFQEDE